ncbi:LTA synthase family protein [Salipaludibacillus sp. HK11]|uniref:LTA synthase family protein n=1 Tax=Salipaludibacillus sp. HK11 TaxID=3394320 RepID=UPI0039FC515B
MKEVSQRQFIVFIAIFLLWIKTIYIGLTEFQISLENLNQLVILLLNPLPILMVGMIWVSTRKYSKQVAYLLLFMTVISLILYANIIYYRAFTDFITLSLFALRTHASELISSIITIIKWSDLTYFIDIIVITILLYATDNSSKQLELKFKLSFIQPFVTLLILITVIHLCLAHIERPQLLVRSFDRELLVKNIGIYNFHIYDTILHTNARAHRMFASEDEFIEIKNSISKEHKIADNDLHGIAEGKNIIVVAAESLQNFVINQTVNNEEITPFLNELIDESFYFNEFYHQTAQGKSSDAEFIVNNSLFPPSRGAVFFSHPNNEYDALPEILNTYGYYTSSLHANNGSFWNRDIMYNQLGYQRFYTQLDYQVTPDNSIGWGLKDIDFMKQSVDHLLEMPQPFYANLISLTNHFPFELGEEDMYIDRYDSNSRTLNKYFPTVRYMDESIKILFEELKNTKLYEESIIIIYGDHDGISSNHNRAMSTYLNKKVTAFTELELQKVPLIIHIPGIEGETITTVSGQVDFRPTLLHLLGIDLTDQIIFGDNLFSEEHEAFVFRRDGSFVSDELVYTGNTCYLKKSGEPTDFYLCEPYIERVNKNLDYSDMIIYGDLFRFNN